MNLNGKLFIFSVETQDVALPAEDPAPVEEPEGKFF